MKHRLIVAPGLTAKANNGTTESIVRERTHLLAVACEDSWEEPDAVYLADWINDVLYHVKHGKSLPKGVVSANIVPVERVAALLSGAVIAGG